jgi:hypothetical protein
MLESLQRAAVLGACGSEFLKYNFIFFTLYEAEKGRATRYSIAFFCCLSTVWGSSS